MLEYHANLDRRLEALAYLVLPFVPTRISRSTNKGKVTDMNFDKTLVLFFLPLIQFITVLRQLDT